MAMKQKFGRLLAAAGSSVFLISLLVSSTASASAGWSQFTKTSTNAQDGQSWYDTAVSYTGQYQVAVGDDGDNLESTNYGQSWMNVTDATSLSGLSWEGVGMSADGNYQVAVVNGGDIYVSSNFGQTWTNKTSADAFSGSDFTGAAVSSTGQYMAAVGNNGGDLIVSSNYGQTWTNETASTPASGKDWDDISMSANGQHMVAVTDGEGIYTSSDFGKTWTNRTPSGPLSSEYIWTVSMSASGQTLYLPVYGGDIYKSTNYGQTWTNITNGSPDLSSSEVYFISTSADGQNVAFAGYAGDVYNSSNGGKNWTNMTTGTTLSDEGFYPLALSGTGEYLTSDVYSGGIYESRNMALAGKTDATVTNAGTGAEVTIATPSGTKITCSSSSTEASQATQDGSYSYPLGLVKLCYSTINSSDKISMTFVTDLMPTDVVARDYNSVTHQWETIPGAVITDTTLNGHHSLMLTYSITDNGPLDSNATLGVVSDPVGLAQTAGAPNTGDGQPSANNIVAYVLIALGFAVVVIGANRIANRSKLSK